MATRGISSQEAGSGRSPDGIALSKGTASVGKEKI